MNIFLILTLALMTDNMLEKPTLIYIGDPMCSWCYGISEELLIAKEELEGKVNFEILVGGLRAGGGEKWTSDFTSFLKHHWKEVSQTSGMEFSYDLLSIDMFNYDTEPSCRAVVVCQSMSMSDVFRFFKEIQRKFYLENKDPKELKFYESICEQIGLDYHTFANRFNSESYKEATADHFSRARKLEVNSFPTLLLKNGDKYHKVGQGYMKSQHIIRNVELLLENNR